MSKTIVRVDGGYAVYERLLHQVSGDTLTPAIERYSTVSDELYAGDDKPFHIALPILETNRISENGLLYDEALISAIEAQLPGKGGNLGHVDSWLRGDEPEIVDWVGHVREGDVTWAKGYMPPGDSRDFARRIFHRGGFLGSSIMGFAERVHYLDDDGETYRLEGFTLLSIDIMTGEKASLKAGIRNGFDIEEQFKRRQPTIWTGVNLSEKNIEESVMPDTSATITMQDVPQTVREEIIAQAQIGQRVEELQGQVSDLTEAQETLTEQIAERDTTLVQVREALGIDSADDIVTAITEAQSRIADLTQAQWNAALTEAVAALTASWVVTTENGKAKVAKFHVKIIAYVKSQAEGRTAENIGELVQQVYDGFFQDEAQLLVESLAGGPAKVAGADPQRNDWREQVGTTEGRAAIKSKWNLGS